MKKGGGEGEKGGHGKQSHGDIRWEGGKRMWTPPMFFGKRDATDKKTIADDRKKRLRELAERNPGWKPVNHKGTPVLKAALGSQAGKTREEEERDKFLSRKITSVDKIRRHMRALTQDELVEYPPNGRHNARKAANMRRRVDNFGRPSYNKRPRTDSGDKQLDKLFGGDGGEGDEPLVCSDDNLILYHSGVPIMLDGMLVIINSDGSIKRCEGN